jgi:hypothetical protein
MFLLKMYPTGMECPFVGQDSFGAERESVIGSCDRVTNLLVSWTTVSFSNSTLLYRRLKPLRNEAGNRIAMSILGSRLWKRQVFGTD